MRKLVESRLYWTALLAAVFAANAVWCWRNRLNGDVAWYLYALARLREGAVLYRDIQDINLPIVYLMYWPIPVLARLTGLPVEAVLYGAIWTTVAFALFLFSRLSLTHRGLLLLTAAFAALSVDRGQLGQRDPIAGVLFAGLVIPAYQEIEHRRRPWWTWPAILAASFALALKPYLLVPWAFLIAGLLWHAGWKRGLRSPVFWIPPALSALSWLATLAYVPDYLRMAKVASRYYNTLNTNSYIEYFPLVLPAWAACKAFQTKRLLPHLTALAALGFAADSILQAKASAYHMAPALFWSFITFAVLAIENDNPKNIVKGSLALAAYSILALALPAGLPRNTVDDFVTQNARGGTVLALTTYPWTAFPLIFEANAKNARPDAALWTIGGMYRDQVERANQSPDFIPARYHTRAEMSDDERRAFDQVVRIVSDERPEIILVQTTPSKWGLDHLQFNFLDYYSADERFREAIRDYQRGPADGHRQVLFRSVPQLHANRAHRSE